MSRCTSAIRLASIATRCTHDAGHDGSHEGNGLFSYQRVEWLPGDRRIFESDRDAILAWEVE